MKKGKKKWLIALVAAVAAAIPVVAPEFGELVQSVVPLLVAE